MGELYTVIGGVSKSLTPEASSGSAFLDTFIVHTHSVNTISSTSTSILNQSSIVNGTPNVFMGGFHLMTDSADICLPFIINKGHTVSYIMHIVGQSTSTGVEIDISLLNTTLACKSVHTQKELYAMGLRKAWFHVIGIA